MLPRRVGRLLRELWEILAPPTMIAVYNGSGVEVVMFKLFGNKGAQDAPQGCFKNGNSHLIDVRDVVKTYTGAAGSFTALKGVDLEVDSHEFLAVVGKSGSGKSTLVNMLTGIDGPPRARCSSATPPSTP